MELMHKPVTLSDGFDYNEDWIRKWFAAGHTTSPMTGEPLEHLELKPNVELRTRIMAWAQERSK